MLYCVHGLCILVIVLLFNKETIHALSGHVCFRQRAEQYMTTYNRGYICPERYTTACGQLDWRRCTKYRVQTCYTPTERYATRYITVEECCPGWKDAGTGQCNIPDCEGGCENGGSCHSDGGVPRCSCVEGFKGDRCQIELNFTNTWEVLFVGVLIMAAIIISAGTVFIYCRIKTRSLCSANHRGSAEEFEMTRPLVRPENVMDPGEIGESEPMRLRFGPITWINGRAVGREPSAPVIGR